MHFSPIHVRKAYAGYKQRAAEDSEIAGGGTAGIHRKVGWGPPGIFMCVGEKHRERDRTVKA